MHHLYPLAKGDPLCPLGFHPQVRWPTRCKRCFRDYKEHGGRKRDEDNNITSSTPSLSTWNSPSSRGSDDDGSPTKDTGRGWASSQNLNLESKKEKTNTPSLGFTRSSASWTSTPNLGGLSDEAKTVTFSLTLPRRKPTPTDTGQHPETQNVVTIRRPSASPPPPPAHLTINKNDSLAERVRKMQALKAHSNSLEKESSQEREKTPVKKDKPREKSKSDEKKDTKQTSAKDDLNFMIQVKNVRAGIKKPPLKGGPVKEDHDKSEHSDLDDDTSSTTGTTTTEGTLVDHNVTEYQEQIDSLKNEMETLRRRCEKVEKEKSDILLRRLANLDTSSGKYTGRSSEVLKLQQKVNELQSMNEDLRDEKKSLSLKVKEIEVELESRPSAELAARQVEQLRAKLLAAETLCEELMDENEDMKKELREMEDEIEEMQDNFREDQADEYSSLRRELEQTTKNCRVLSFKLKKTERRVEQLELEKSEQEKKLLEIVGGQSGLDRVAKIKELQQELGRSNEVALRLQKELQDANAKLTMQPPANQKKNPSLVAMQKTQSADGKLSRSTLTRGGSQDDPQQLLRDLQDSLEREADLREQLKNAEEEAINLRKKASRVEDDNESLLLQLKKMATKARTRKLSPTAPVNRLPVEPAIEKDEGISDEEDPAELRILLELNEQEAAVLRRKVEELEQEGDSLKRQVKELSEKVTSGNNKSTNVTVKKVTTKANSLSEEKIKVLEGEIADLRKKLIEKERDCERLHAELSLTQKRPKGSLIKSKSLDGNGIDQNSIDLRRQLQVIEQEASVLRTKTQSLELDNEKLQVENKKLQLMSGTKSLKADKSFEQSVEKISQLETELKEALVKVKDLELFKMDAEKAGKRVTFGGEQTKKDIDKIKLKQEEIDKLKQTLTKVESERNKLTVSLKELKEDALKSFKPRTPKKLTDFTTKLQLKKMVEDLENEIGEMFVVMKNADLNSPDKNNSKATWEKSMEDLRAKLSKTESELTNEKNRLQTEITQMKEQNESFVNEKKVLTDKVKSYEGERDKALQDWRAVSEEKKKIDVEVNRLNVELKNATTKQTAMADCMKKIEELKKETEEKDKQIEKMKKELDLTAKIEQDKNKLVKEIGDKTKKITELDKKLKESEDKCKRTEKMLSARKDRVTKLEKELSEEKEQSETIASTQRRMSTEWISERDSLQTKLCELESKLGTIADEWKEKLSESEGKVISLESHIAAKVTHIQQLESAMRDMSNQKYDEAISPIELAQLREKLENAQRDLAIKEQELSSTKQDLTTKHVDFSKLQDEVHGNRQTILKLQHDHKDLENKLKTQTKDADHWESKTSELEIDLTAERKKIERMKLTHEKDVKNKEIELATLKGKLRILEQTSGAGSKKINELKDDYEEKLKKLQHELVMERQEYDELTGKYELLEEEHVVTKARLTVEKETAQGQLIQLQRDLNVTSSELKAMQETYNSKTDAWIKETIELQDKLSATEERLCGGGWEVEKARLQARLDEKQKEVDRIKQERDVTVHQQESLKKEHEELRQKLDDYDRVSKIQRNLATENANMDTEIKSLQEKIDQSERSKKIEISENKARYEAQALSMQDEMKSLQVQVSRFKRERDTFKSMLDNAQKNLSEMKMDTGGIKNKRHSVTNVDELEESKSRLAVMEQQVNCMEDELCEARLLASKLKTELISEKSSSEIKLAEMQSRLNEYEEDRLLTSGRTKIPGMRTRMELAWQKERDEQQRLLQETSTLARDLRQTLFELERERDKERLDMKRRLEQLKRSTEEDQDENKKKVSELQCDLLELRDAHAKLRTTNEKLRRERERHEKDKDTQRLNVAAIRRQQQEDDKRIAFLLEQIDELIHQSPDLGSKLGSNCSDISYLTPTPPRRNRSKSQSREATPESGISDHSVQSTLSRIQKAAEELKATRQMQKRQIMTRRAASSEPGEDRVIVTTITPRAVNGKAPPLSKRSISLEQTNKDNLGIWKTDDDSVSSMQSLDAELDSRLFTMQRDTSLDSRLSGGSTQSDVLPSSDKKKKKGFLGKLKQLTKSRSIDDQAGPDSVDFKTIGSVSQGSDSDMSTSGSKKDIRGKLSDIFSRKGGQHSRSASKERGRELNTPVPDRTDSSQRPLSRNGSATQIPQLSVRSDTSATSRSMSVTPGMQRKKK